MESKIHQLKKANATDKLNVLSIFLTVDGEANCNHVGSWSVFVRLTGCRVGCNWCDTKYSWSLKQGKQLTPHAVLNYIKLVGKGCMKVTFTGGEPLEQNGPEFRTLLQDLVNRGYCISIETAGTHSIESIRRRFSPKDVSFVVDYKLSSAKAKFPNDTSNFKLMGDYDVLKFVIDSEQDFKEAMYVCREKTNQGLYDFRKVLSPSFGNMDAATLFTLMKEDFCPSLNIGLNLQMHKYIFSSEAESFRLEEGEGLDFSRK